MLDAVEERRDDLPSRASVITEESRVLLIRESDGPDAVGGVNGVDNRLRLIFINKLFSDFWARGYVWKYRRAWISIADVLESPHSAGQQFQMTLDCL